MAEDGQKKQEETPENQDVVWNVVPDDSELENFKKIWRRRLLIHLGCAFFAALLFGIIAYSDVFDPPANKLEPEFVKQTPIVPAEKEVAAELERLKKAFTETADPAALKKLQRELAELLNGPLKDNPAALKLHFELTEKIRVAGSENE